MLVLFVDLTCTTVFDVCSDGACHTFPIYHHALKFLRSLTCCGSEMAHAAFAFFDWGFMPMHMMIYLKYSISMGPEDNMPALTGSPASCKLVRTTLSLSRWSFRLAFVMDNNHQCKL